MQETDVGEAVVGRNDHPAKSEAARRPGPAPTSPPRPPGADRGPDLPAPACPAHPQPAQFGGPRRRDHDALHSAHASRYHWGEVGEPVNLARGEWQCSRVYAVLGRAEPALWHAGRCVAINQANGIADKDDREVIEGDLDMLP